MERWVKISNDNWFSINLVKDLLEIFLLEWLQFLESNISSILVLSNDHFSEMLDSLLFKEHMLSSAKSNSFSTIFESNLDLMWFFGIGFDHHGLVFLGPFHDSVEIFGHFWVHDFNLSIEDFTSSTIKGDVVTFTESFTTNSDSLIFVANDKFTATGNTAFSHSSSNDSSMRSHTTSSGKDTLSSIHTDKIFRGCLNSGQDNSFSSLGPFVSLMRVEDNSSDSSTW